MSESAAGLPENPSANAIRNAMQAGRVAEVVARLKALAPGRRAGLFLQLRAADQKTLLAVAPPDLTASMLADCDSASLAPLLESYDLSALKPTLRLIPEDDLADILLHLPPERRGEGLSALDAASAEQVRALMTFDPESAGGLMTPRYLSVPEVVTAGRALELLRSAKEADSASYVYATDAGGRLTGVIPLRQLLLANPRRPVSEAMVPSVVQLKVSTPRDAIVETFGQHHFVSLPVVDEKDRLVGIVTSEAVMKALRRREESVLQGVTGVDPRRERLKQTLAATRGRLPWITVTIAGGLGCALIGKLFQRTLDEIVMVGIFTPLVLALGESVGAQTASVVLAGRDEGAPAEERKAFVLKELGIGVLVAVYAGVLVAALSHLWHGSARLGALIGGSVLLSMVWAVLLAVLVPGLLRRMKVNPAIASGPLVLTLADFSTLLLYFGTASASLELLEP